MEDSQPAIGILVDPHPRLHPVVPQRTVRQLQLAPPPAHGVVTAHHALLLHAQRLDQRRRVSHRHKPALRQGRRPGKAGVVRRQVDIADPGVGPLDVADPGPCQLLDQAILQRAEHPLRTAPRLGRVGRDMLDPQPLQRPANLRRPLPVDRRARLRRVKVVAATVGIQARRQTMGAEHLQQRPQRRGGAFLLDQKRRVDPARRIVQRHDQVQRRLPRKPHRT